MKAHSRMAMLFVGMMILLCISSPAISRPTYVLALDYPYAAIFMEMADRAVGDYVARKGQFPGSLDEAVSKGYTAYFFPQEFQPSYNSDASSAYIEAIGKMSFGGGIVTDPIKYVVKMPDQTLFHYVKWGVPVEGNPDNRQEQEIKVWNFNGAQWLDAGYGWYDVDPALRYDRLWRHLVWASSEYSDSYNQMPSDLADLESYVGVERNPAGWQNVNLVNFLGDVQYNVGNLFIGWDGSDWVVSINAGPEVLTERFVQSDSGDWVFTQQDALVY